MYVAAFPFASKANDTLQKIPMISLHFVNITTPPLSDGRKSKIVLSVTHFVSHLTFIPCLVYAFMYLPYGLLVFGFSLHV